LYLGIDELYRFVGEKRNGGVWISWGNGKGEEILLLPSLQKKGFKISVSIQFGVTERGEILHRWALWV